MQLEGFYISSEIVSTFQGLLQKILTTTGKRHPKVSTRGSGEKNFKKAEKWWDCHTFRVNMEGQRLMCVFKELEDPYLKTKLFLAFPHLVLDP
jgi:hypothetical protein